MKRLKKRTAVLLGILSALTAALTVLAVLGSCHPYGSAVKEILDYGECIEKTDIPPNTIVARFNGEEILFHEVESARNSIDYAVQNGHNEFAGDSAFYNVLKNKLYAQTAINQKNASNYNLNVQQNLEKAENEWRRSTYAHQQEWLETLCIAREEIWLSEDDFVKYLQKRSIDKMLVSKGMGIISDTIFENPDLVSDRQLAQSFKRGVKSRESESIPKFFAFFGSRIKLYKDLEDTYTEDLILASELELCADEGVLSTAAPIIKY